MPAGHNRAHREHFKPAPQTRPSAGFAFLAPVRRSIERMAQHDGARTLGAGRYHIDRHAQQFFQPAQIAHRVGRQLIEAAGGGDALPAGQFLVDGLAARRVVGAGFSFPPVNSSLIAASI